MTAVIFGDSGQDAYYLRRLLESKNVHCIGVSRPNKSSDSDITCFESVASLIKSEQPERIYHLAAVSSTQHRHILENHDTIVKGTLNMLEAAFKYAPSARIFIAGSGLQFENMGLPISESARFSLSSSYALARNQSVEIARYYRQLGLAVYVGYLFHHESPRRDETHVSGRVVKAVKQISRGQQSKLEIGSLKVRKEWTFAGDVVQAIEHLLDQSDLFEAAIGSGEDYSIEQWVEACFSQVSLDWREYVDESPGFVPEYGRLVSDPSTIMSLGWKPEVSFEELAEMMIKSS